MKDLSTSSDTYGLQIYDGGSPNTVIFDSRRFNSIDTFYFSNIIPPRSISGDKDVADAILSTTNEYVDILNMPYDEPTGGATSGAMTGIYSPSSTSNVVRFSNYFFTTSEDVNNERASNYRIFPNFFSIAVGDLR